MPVYTVYINIYSIYIFIRVFICFCTLSIIATDALLLNFALPNPVGRYNAKEVVVITYLYLPRY